MGLYASDGSINLLLVDGTAFTGRYSASGEWNVFYSLGTGPVGAYHPTGALWVTLATTPVTSQYAPDGSMYVQESPYGNGAAVKVTFTGSGSGATFGTPIGLLLALTKAS